MFYEIKRGPKFNLISKITFLALFVIDFKIKLNFQFYRSPEKYNRSAIVDCEVTEKRQFQIKFTR